MNKKMKKPGPMKCGSRSLRVLKRVWVWVWMSHVLRRLIMRRVNHGLDAWDPLLLHRVSSVGSVLSIGHNWQHVRRARFFIEVRNAYTAVFVVVVGTIILLLLRGPVRLCQVLETLLHALLEISTGSRNQGRLSGIPFARLASISLQHEQQECSTFPGGRPCMLVLGCLV